MNIFENVQAINDKGFFSHVEQGTAVATIVASLIACLDLYVDSMQKSIEQRSLNEDKPYFAQLELKAVHNDAKAQALSLV